MPDRSTSRRCLRCVVLTCVALAACLALAAPALAGGGPSVENCRDKGLIDVSCIVCSTGEYKGKISIQAEYDPDYGDCMKNYRGARQMCISTYNLDAGDAGCKWSYSMGGKQYSGMFPSYCKK